MNIPEITFVTIGTTAKGIKELVDAVSGKTPRLHGLSVVATTVCTMKLASGSTAGSTSPLIGAAIPMAANGHFRMSFVKVIEGSVPGTSAKNLQISSTASALTGWAFVSSSSY